MESEPPVGGLVVTGEQYRPRGSEGGSCRNCGAFIVWAWTGHKGRRMPLDATEYAADDRAANVAIRRDHTGRLLCRVIDADNGLAAFERRRMPHFATCPPLVAERERKASLRRARASAPHPADTDALHDARQATQAAQEPAVVRDELAAARTRRRARGGAR